MKSEKGWRIRNTGTCTWDSNYVLAYVGSNPPNSPVGGNPVAIQGTVEPGQTYDVFVTITTPFRAGTFQSFWTLRAPTGLFLGERIWAGFQVVMAQTATPQPETPQIFSFSVIPSQISEGGCVDVNWSYGGRDITASRLFRSGQVILFDMPTNGSFNDCPPGTGQVEYRLVIDSATAGSAVGSRVVRVIPAAQPTDTPLPTDVPTPTSEPPPVIDSFTANPQAIDFNDSVELSWSFSGFSLADARLFRGDDLLAQDLTSPGTFVDTPPVTGQVVYRLVVYSEFSGSTEQSVVVTVNAPAPEPQSALEMAWERFLGIIHRVSAF